MPLQYTTLTQNGDTDPLQLTDYLIGWGATGNTDHTLSGGAGNDFLMGDFGNFWFGVSGNNSIGAALNIDAANTWYTVEIPTIIDSATIPHTTMFVTGEDQLEYFEITVANAGDNIIIDTDFATFDTTIEIVDGSGTQIDFEDDGTDPGTPPENNSFETYLTHTFAAAGTYYIILRDLNGANFVSGLGGDVAAGQNAIVNISLENHNATGTIADFSEGDDILNGGDGNDQLYGMGGADDLFGDADDDYLDGGAGADRAYGGTGDDTIVFSDDAHIAVGSELINGGADTDTLLLAEVSTATAQTYDLKGSDIVDIEQINFLDTGASSGDRTLELTSSHIGPGIASDATIFGNTHNTDSIEIVMNGSSVDLSLWTFSGWDAGDTITIFGDTDTETITGSSQNDIIYGGGIDFFAGPDTINAGAGDDILIATFLQPLSNSNGGTGIDTYDARPHEANNLVADLQAETLFDGAFTYDLIDFENFFGSVFDDSITGNAEANDLRGEGGNDTIEGGAGDDMLDGGLGTDTLSYAGAASGVTINLDVTTGQNTGGAGTDTVTNFEDIIGSDHGDDLAGTNAANIIQGGDGSDLISGFGGVDELYGGSGNDSFAHTLGSYIETGDIIDGGTGINSLYFVSQSAGQVYDARQAIISNVQNLEYLSQFSHGAEVILNVGQIPLNNIYTDAHSGDVYVLTLHMNGATALDLSTTTFSGAGFNEAGDVINIIGGAAAETVTGSSASDNFQGGDGVDVFIQSNDGVANTFNGGAGYGDRLDLSGATAAWSVDVSSAVSGASSVALSGVESVTGTAFADTFTEAGILDNIDGGAGDDLFIGYVDTNDDFDGGAGSDTLNFSADTLGVVFNLITGKFNGNDAINFENAIGGSGDDVFTASADANNIDGGAGTDTVSYASSTAGVTVNLDANNYVNGYAVGDSLSNIENLIGSAFGDNLVGTNTNGNVLTGGGGNDTLHALDGLDELYGGTGNDAFRVDDGELVAGEIYDGGADTDTLRYMGNGASLFDARGVTITDVEILQFSQTFGGGETVQINADQFAFTTVSLSNSNATNGGTLEIFMEDLLTLDLSALSFTGAWGVDDNETLLIQGDADAETITGSSFGDTINAGDGDDTIIWLTGGGSDTIDGGAGSDTLDTSDDGSDQVISLVNGTGTTGSDVLTLSNIENVITGAGDDRVEDDDNDSTANAISTGAGDDEIVKFSGTSAGAVNMYDGGDDIDTLIYDDNFPNGNAGTEVNLSTGKITFNGADRDTLMNIENVTLIDIAGSIVGDDGDNVLIAMGDRDNSIDGGLGNDTIEGGEGADTLTGGTGNDTLSYASDTTGVTVFLSNNTVSGGHADGDIVSGFENVTGGSGNDTLYGNSQVNILTGNDGVDSFFANGGADTVFGGAGNDTLRGGVGDDILYGGDDDDNLQGNNQQDMLFGDAGNDALTGGGGNDDLFGGDDMDTLIGNSGQDELYGGAGDDDLSGNAGGDDLFGGAGADRLHGGGGNDDMFGGTGADIFEFTTGFRVDRIKDFEDGIDLIDVTGHSSWNVFQDILDDANQVGNNVIIQVNPNNRMVIENYDLADLDATDFIF